MSRLQTMSRYQEPDDIEPDVMSQCEECGEPLLEGEEVLKMEDDYFCDDFCCHQFHEIKTVILGEDN